MFYRPTKFCCLVGGRRGEERRGEERRGEERRVSRITIPSVFLDDDIIVYRLDYGSGTGDFGAEKTTRPVIVAIPGTSEAGVAGLLGWIDDYQDSAALTLAEAGYVVYAVQLAGDGERAIDTADLGRRGYTSTDIFSRYASLAGKPIMGLWVRELLQVVDYLRHEEGLSGCIATFGISRGGVLAYHTAAFSEQVTAVISASGLSDLDAVIHPIVEVPAYAPGMYAYLRSSDVAATVAPRPMLITWGAQESEAKTTALLAVSRVAPAYELLGERDNLVALPHSIGLEGGHTWDSAATLSFLRQHCPTSGGLQNLP